MSNSINSKSGLYKIPLFYTDLNTLTYEQICDKAKIPNTSVKWPSYNDWTGIDRLKLLWGQSIPLQSQNKIVQSLKIFDKKAKIDFPGVVESKRNNTAFEIAKQLKGLEFTLNESKDHIVNKWNPKNMPPVKDIQTLYRTVESAYSYNHYDYGSIGITKHLRTDPYYNSIDGQQKAIYLYFLARLNEVEKKWRKYICKPNQCIFSYGSVAHHLQIDVQRVKTLVKKLVKWGRASVETLYENGQADCSKITFHNIDLTQYLTRPNDLSNNSDKLTHYLTTTNIINKKNSNNILNEALNDLNISIKQINKNYTKLEKKLSKIDNNKKWLTGINDISKYFGIGNTKVSELIKSEQLKSYRVGKKVMVRISDVDSFIMFEKPFNKLTRPQKATVNCNE